jgi:hypothetical protein
MNNFDQILKLLKNYDYLGVKKTQNGTLLIGKAPHIAPMASLHSIYPPLTDEEIKNLELSIGLDIPPDYKSFLKITNGLGIFNNTMSLFGLRNNYKRTPEDAQQQPFHIKHPNTLERPENAGKNIFCIGGYSSGDGAWLYLNADTNAVHLSERWKVKSLFEWRTLEVMLISEVNRLVPLFDKEGKKIDRNKSTLPIIIT